jgi:hypothetical protein
MKKIYYYFIRKIFLIIILYLFFNCSPAQYKNACNPSDKIFQTIIVLKTFINDNSAYCGIQNIISGSNANNSNTVALPVFNPNAGNYNTPQNITITTTTVGATIYYTVDGTVPNTSSSVFSIALPIWSTAGKTIKAYAVKQGMSDSSVITGVFSYQPMKTRQATSYAIGDDANANQGVSPSYTGPTQHSVYTSDYTTTDNATGLVWKSCSEGKTGANCSTGTILTAGIIPGTNACSSLNSANGGNGFAGRTNWRLPTMKELTTLTDYSKTSLTHDTTAFPGSANFAYWSSTSYPPNGGFAWYVDYSSANSFATTSTNGYHSRCISAPTLSETTSYTDNVNGTVTDNVTGLIWQKCSQGQNNDTSCSGATVISNWSNALTYCNTLSLASKTWRLPNINELGSIYDFTVSTGTAINLTAFPNTPNGNPGGYYWSSSTDYITVTSAWFLNFGVAFNSYAFSQSKATSYNVRCVTGP